jgi:hypothetical protein
MTELDNFSIKVTQKMNAVKLKLRKQTNNIISFDEKVSLLEGNQVDLNNALWMVLKQG